MPDETEKLSAILAAFYDDVIACLGILDGSEYELDEHSTQFWRRTLVRACFAYIEGTIHYMKRIAVKAGRRDGALFSAAELALLSDETYNLSDKGEAVATPAKVSVTKSIRFAFRAFARSASTSYDIRVNDDGWVSFMRGLKTRDRLMHPKEIQDLLVSDDELLSIRKTVKWFNISIGECLDLIIETQRENIGKLPKAG